MAKVQCAALADSPEEMVTVSDKAYKFVNGECDVEAEDAELFQGIPGYVVDGPPLPKRVKLESTQSKVDEITKKHEALMTKLEQSKGQSGYSVDQAAIESFHEEHDKLMEEQRKAIVELDKAKAEKHELLMKELEKSKSDYSLSQTQVELLDKAHKKLMEEHRAVLEELDKTKATVEAAKPPDKDKPKEKDKPEKESHPVHSSPHQKK
jgi:hypothetical protein